MTVKKFRSEFLDAQWKFVFALLPKLSGRGRNPAYDQRRVLDDRWRAWVETSDPLCGVRCLPRWAAWGKHAIVNGLTNGSLSSD